MCQQCRLFRQFYPVIGGKGKARTVSLAPPNVPRGQNEKKKQQTIKPSMPLCHFKTPIWSFKCCLTRTFSYFFKYIYYMSMNVSINILFLAHPQHLNFWAENFSGNFLTCHLQACVLLLVDSLDRVTLAYLLLLSNS